MLKAGSLLFSCLRKSTKMGISGKFSLCIAANIFKPISKHSYLLLKSNVLKDLNSLPSTKLFSSDSLNAVHDLAEKILNENVNADINDTERKDELLKVLKFFLSKGVSRKDIQENCIKYIDGSSNSYFKAVLMSELDSNISVLLPLMSLSVRALRLAAKHARNDKSAIKDFPNRIAYLAYHLDIPPVDLIPALAKHHSLLTMKFYRLEHKMNILKSAGINPRYIVKDLWIFNYNEKLLANRIAAAAEAGVDLKPWMLRSSEKIFESMLIKYSKTKQILGNDDEVTYLAKRLDCTKEYIDCINEKNKLLKAINIPKVEQVLNFLYSKGYTPQEVRLFPRVFCSSVQTLSRNYEEISKFKSTLPTCSQLCLTDRRLRSKLKKSENVKAEES